MSHIDKDKLHAYLDGACDAAEHDEFERHLSECSDCSRLLEEADSERRKASELLAQLEPGPVRAPAWEDLETRAAQRAQDRAPAGTSSAAAAGTGTSAGGTPVVPWWRRPQLAWAASLVIAFGLGWLSRSELGFPTGAFDEGTLARQQMRQAPVSSPEGNEEADRRVARDTAAAETPVLELEEAEPLTSDARVRSELAAVGPTAPEGGAAAVELGDLQAAAKRQVAGADQELRVAALEPVPDPAQARAKATTTENEPERAIVADNKERRENAQAPPPAGPGEYEAGRVRQYRLGDALDAAAADTLLYGFSNVPLVDAERWLGAPPRQLPELSLVRIDVGPYTSIEEGLPGLPVVHLVYQDALGQEIVLSQQYAAAVLGAEPGLAGKNRVVAGALRPEAQQGQTVGARRDADLSELYAAFPERSARLRQLRESPSIVVDPPGRASVRWVDSEGYLLTLSGEVDADALRSLADLLR